jgi:trehalose/maltose hydrolase-like predicted phosphorylase
LLYGWSGFRWRSDQIHLAPALPDQWATGGLTLRGLAYQGRDPVPVEGGGMTAMLRDGQPVTMPTRRLSTSGCGSS